MAFVSCYKVIVICLAILLMFIGSCSSSVLDEHFYSKSCPELQTILTDALKIELRNDQGMGASLLRLHFHDCFVQGCDGSVLLDVPNGEKSAPPNANSLRGFDVIDTIKSNVEKKCPGVVTCADILALAARESVFQQGGPRWKLEFGRYDSKRANQAAAKQNLPSPSSNISQLIQRFKNFGFTTKDLVALSGAHTIGQARCTNFRNRIWQENNIDSTFANIVRPNCSQFGSNGDGNNPSRLDYVSPIVFDNFYFKNLVVNRGLLHSDQQLFFKGNRQTNKMVITYRNDQNAFFNDFAYAMTKMSRLSPHTKRHGEIRRNCRSRN